MDLSTILILSGFLLLILVTLAAVRYTSAGLLAAKSARTVHHTRAKQKSSEQEENHRWLRFLLVIAASLAPLQAICMALHVFEKIPYQNSIPALAPTLAGVLTIALARWRSFQELGIEGRKERSGLLAALMVVNGANLAVYSNLAVTLLAISVFIALVWMLALRIGDGLLGFTSLVVVIWFAVYSSGALFSLLPSISQMMSFILYLLNTAMGTLALLLPALLLFKLLNDERKPLLFSLRLITALFLLSIAVYWSYYGAATASARPYLAAAEYYPFTQLLAATVSGFLLAAYLDKHKRIYGPAFAILASMLLIMASNLGWIDTALATLHKYI